MNNGRPHGIINMILFIFLFMSRPVTITTTLDPLMNKWLKEEAKRQKTTKRVIMERALKKYMLEDSRQKYIDSFKKAARDPEMLWLADAGLGDFLDMINEQEK